MATALQSVIPGEWTLAETLDSLGGIAPSRIRMIPPPGTATEADVLEAERRWGRPCELIDGILVEKIVGSYESIVAAVLSIQIGNFVTTRKLGVIAGDGGPFKILPRQVRVPDISYISWERFPGGQLPDQAIYAVVPDLAVEVLSAGNTPGEMQRKLQDYFQAGVRLVWYIDPVVRTATVYTSPTMSRIVREDQILNGGDVLPGFEVRLAEVFAQAGLQRPE